MQTPTVLVDTSVISLGKSDPAYWTRKDPKHNDFFQNKYFVYVVKEMNDDERELFKLNIAIGSEARKKSFSFYTSQELWIESIVGYQSMNNNFSPLYAFHDIKWNFLPSPIERARFFQSADFTKGKEVELFMDFLLKTKPKDFNEIVNAAKDVSDFERECVKKISFFQHLCRDGMFGRSRARDVYHLWTGECHNVNYFLTLDLKFLNVYSSLVRQNKLNLECRVVSPQNFADELNITVAGIELPEAGKTFFMNGSRFN